MSMTQVSVHNCPNLILAMEHWNSDGSCRCSERGHREMAAWGYEWDEKLGRWTVSDEAE